MNHEATSAHHNSTLNRQPGWLTEQSLAQQNERFQGCGGVSRETRGSGFRPAFADTGTGVVYLSRFADGRPAPMHLLEGLPAEVVVERTAGGRVRAVKETVIAGFVREQQFYTREQAAAAVRAH